MRYALLICDEEKRQAEMSEDEAGGPDGRLHGLRRGDGRAVACCRAASACSRRRPPPPCASATARCSPPTVRSRRPRSRWPASTWSTARTSTRPSRWRRRSRAPAHGSIEVRPDLGDVDARARRRASSRPCVPGGVGTCRRHPHPDHGRLGPRRGVRAGRLRPGARTVAARRRPGQPRGLAHHDRTQPCARPAAACADAARRSSGRPRSSCPTTAPAGGRRQRRGRRPAPAHLHVLSPGAVGRGAGRADAAHARRPDHRRDRACVPRARADDGAAARAGEAQDPRRRHPVPRPARAPAARSARTRCSRCCTCCSTRATSRAAAPSCVRADLAAEAIRLARTLTELMPDEPEAIALLALMLLHDARRAGRVDDDGDLVPLDDQDRTRWDQAMIAEGQEQLDRALRRQRPGPYQVQAAIAACHATAPTAGRHRLARDRAALRGAGAHDRLAGGGAQPRGGGGDGRRSRRRPRARRRARPTGSTTTATCTRPAPTCCDGSTVVTRPPSPTRARSSLTTAAPNGVTSNAASPRSTASCTSVSRRRSRSARCPTAAASWSWVPGVGGRRARVVVAVDVVGVVLSAGRACRLLRGLDLGLGRGVGAGRARLTRACGARPAWGSRRRAGRAACAPSPREIFGSRWSAFSSRELGVGDAPRDSRSCFTVLR